MGVVGVLVLARFLPKTFLWDRLVLKESVAGLGGDVEGVSASSAESSLVGAVAVAVSDLMPSGEIEIDGRRYDAKLNFGSADRGTQVRVVSKSDFGYIVEIADS